MAENNSKNYVDSLKNFLPDSNIDPKLMIPIITSLEYDKIEKAFHKKYNFFLTSNLVIL